MPSTPRRRLTRRSLPPRPTYEGAPGAEAAPPILRQNAETRRVSGNPLRHAPYLAAELRRIAGVAAICLGLLAVLTVVDRMR
ncbi:MAG: hypothetical protein EXR68_07230 [Dehalococcoidia bacterium]|nr:hypothetical protein [Dehalococcoidia bacterium]